MNILKDLVTVFFTSLGSLIVLFVLTKIIGNKQMSELTMYDYIISITIGSIAAEMASDFETFHRPLFAMIVYAAFSVAVSVISLKSVKLRRIFLGKSVLLFKNGVFYKKNMKKSRIDINEFLIQCRSNGYFDLNEISLAFLEPTGKLSFLPADSSRPATCTDLNVAPKASCLMENVIIDGRVLTQNLESLGKNEAWLINELKNKKVKSPSEVFLATLSQNGTLNIFTNTNEPLKNDPFI